MYEFTYMAWVRRVQMRLGWVSNDCLQLLNVGSLDVRNKLLYVELYKYIYSVCSARFSSTYVHAYTLRNDPFHHSPLEYIHFTSPQ